MVDLFKTYIRPGLEYCTPVWSPHLISDIDTIEKVQKHFTKRLPGLWNRNYAERLQILNLESLEVRRIKNDLIFLFQIVKNLVDMDSSELFTYNTSATRGHSQKINVQRSRLNCRKYWFINRTVPIWNSLPQIFVDARTSNAFKSLLNEYNLTPFCRGHAHMVT